MPFIPHPSHFHPTTTHSKSSEVMAAAEIVQVLDEEIGYGEAEGVEPVADLGLEAGADENVFGVPAAVDAEVVIILLGHRARLRGVAMDLRGLPEVPDPRPREALEATCARRS